MGFFMNFSMKIWMVCFYLLGCEAKPGQKEIPRLEKKMISQVVEDHHNPKVDILFIVDDSPSMGDYQERLKMNASLFINRFLDVDFIDYHIGVTTPSVKNLYSGNSSQFVSPFVTPTLPSSSYDSSYNGGMLVEGVSEQDGSKYHYVDKNNLSGDQLLSDMMGVGKGGSGVETFLNIPEIAFSDKMYETQNNGFLRPGAHLAIFVITDTDDQSGILPQQAYEYLLNLKGGDERKLHYAAAVVFMERENCEFDPTGSQSSTPDLLMEMVELFGDRGYSFDLCKSNYGEDLARIARSIVFSILTINLDDLPDISSIRVCSRDDTSKEREFCEKGQEIFSGPDGWSYDIERNTIHLSPNIVLDDRLSGRFDIQFNSIYSPDSGG